jgi:RNA polymerase sigma-70 factor (ECF subfamily)
VQKDRWVKAASVAIAFEDAALVEQCRRGDLSAVGPLIEKYQDRVFNTCWRLCGNSDDAADLTQEAFVKAMEAIGTFDGRSRFYTWVFRIAVNLALSHRRKVARQRTVSLPGAADGAGGSEAGWPAADVPRPDEVAAAREEQARVTAALGELEDEHRTMLVLRDMEAFDYQQIAEILSIPVGTVKSRMHRARLALREKLGPVVAAAAPG